MTSYYKRITYEQIITFDGLQNPDNIKIITKNTYYKLDEDRDLYIYKEGEWKYHGAALISADFIPVDKKEVFVALL